MTSNKLSELQPEQVWRIFYEITQVPRPSKKEEKIREWIKSWAKENNIKFKEDETGNLLLTKEASKGCEKYPTLIIQAHMDMVCQADDPNFNCEEDPIPVTFNDKYVFSQGTSLGADNGLGLAMGLALFLDDEVKHGKLELLITVDEETGLTGAFNVKKGFFTGKYLLNVDSEDLGKITISSAGGGGTQIDIPIEFESIDNPENWVEIRFVLSGLQGGHSGVDINLPRANAIKVAISALNFLRDKLTELEVKPFHLVSIEGGTAHNAIPRDCSVRIALPKENEKEAKKALKEWFRKNSHEIKEYEPNFKFEMFEKDNVEKIFTEETTKNVIYVLDEIQHGVISYSKEISDLVQTSNNLAVVKTSEKQVEIHVSTRSSVMNELEEVRLKLKKIGEKVSANVSQGKAYPGWEPNLNSPFLKLVKEQYEQVYKKEVKLEAIHAGLECSLFLALDPNLQVTSIGPTILSPHSPDEKVEIESVGVIWEVIRSIAENMNKLP
ncbi:MAG: beta-Ala-His dipeptidase [Candidatus Heimdallarchaeum aukensis]|uniref:Beta-Ala-His dipeptidase n=1 Tax=Candidatus Heimdallarchaeum aukensis TaxID=2876573 RepID=A0A9Y1BLX1_9ARCH|nr:MAG: beta-Ala-His dipeptidase [Candidatus Heimdallarchaeum aukensis]